MSVVSQEYSQTLGGFHTRHEKELLILLYHGVTESDSQGIENYSGKHIQKKDFVSQIEWISKNCKCLSVDQVVEFHRSNIPFPPRSVLVTFDDGFENNYLLAAPVLSEYSVPAVFYITAGVVGTEKMFWVDQIEDCINRTKEGSVEIELDCLERYPLQSESDKIHCLEAIKSFCKQVPVSKKDRVIDQLVSETKVAPSVSAAENYKKLNWQQLREMAGERLFTIGGHSLNHNILSMLSVEEMREDITRSLSLLRSELDDEIVHYSYPEGQANHYNDEVIGVLQDNGVVCSPSAMMGLNPSTTDLFHLRRLMVGFAGIPFPFWDKSL